MTIADRIEALRTEAAAHGDTGMVEMCDRAADYQLRGYDTAEPVSPEELGVDVVRYVEAICESLDDPDGSGTGAVACGSHTVYAQ